MRVFAILILLACFQTAAADVIYGVVPPLFGGEPLRAVTARLDKIENLGVDILWLSPLQATDDLGHISYSITDYWRLREDFGSPEDLRALIQGAHARGMKVILDFVPNHTSDAHPFFGQARYYDFYQRDAGGNPVYYFDWENLPNLNYENASVLRMMNSVMRFWLREFGLDGYRMDAAWGPRERSPKAWPQMVAAIRDENPRAILLAEAGAGDRYYADAGFDWAYDWGAEVGEWAWRRAFDEPERTGKLLAEALRAESNGESRLRFLNNNDTGERFISRYGEDVTRAAAVVQFMVPGAALIYTGDETGAEYEPYEDPPPLSWKDPRGLRALYKKLSGLHAREPALRGKPMRVLDAESPRALVFERGQGAARLVIAADFAGGGSPVRVRGTVKGGYRDLLSGRCLKIVNKQGLFTLPAGLVRVLRPAAECN